MRQRTSFLVGMDDVTEPTTLRLVISCVVVVAMLFAAVAFGW